MVKTSDDRYTKKSSAPKRRRLNPDERRVELLEAALQVLRSRDPVDARVEDVTARAGAAKGTFYLYFPSWNDLLVAVRTHLLSSYINEMSRRWTDESANWWVSFEKECLYFVDYIVELGNLHQAIFHGPIADQPIEAELSANTLLSSLLNEGIESGHCRPVDVEAAAPLLFSVLHTTADGILHEGDKQQKTASLIELLRAWLLVPTPNHEEAVKALGGSPKLR